MVVFRRRMKRIWPFEHGGRRRKTGGRPVDDRSHLKGSLELQRVRAGIILISPCETTHEHTLKLKLSALNNEAEYEALIAGLKIPKGLDIEDLVVYSDSKLVVNQVSGEYEARNVRMKKKIELQVVCYGLFPREPLVRDLPLRLPHLQPPSISAPSSLSLPLANTRTWKRINSCKFLRLLSKTAPPVTLTLSNEISEASSVLEDGMAERRLIEASSFTTWCCSKTFEWSSISSSQGCAGCTILNSIHFLSFT
ncbi:hypothetical protein Vadar_012303 [Vaccinium darrowii]|uniref:Uncharacterized protein n=1 Tax=Vaccinium darrowii TaxID=229202 RepID=A0ACB7YMA9_9ERIC|nr:hypothetical protein Vadar_012303 [Vaccinium darrowii]